MNMGLLHSIETFGAVDGPGIRTVFFLQGCPARCAYCHNPDTWRTGGGHRATVGEIVARAKRGIPYYGEDGGVTFSGGEPLMQGKFVSEAINALKEEGISSAIDTSGTYFDKDSEAAIAVADLILLDIKHVDSEEFHNLTGRYQETLFKVIDAINRFGKHVWIRQVIMPGYNDTEAYIESLNGFLRRIKYVDKVELLGYHNMAVNKYKKLDIPYKLADMPPMNKQRLMQLNELVRK
ncbi:MAG: pyruvate formate lyase-activating protein [Emergencia sp.]|jgi:pyruvate formate lyase activating enzyme|uniref:pyruvate formate-lyase-activating protein n=1 Tax=Emergencia sp. JLR.KK010 TaxID=3114296 RepID=UPI00203E39B1|nr:pyruvate formate lyase-activating protein [Emergencia sp.]